MLDFRLELFLSGNGEKKTRYLLSLQTANCNTCLIIFVWYCITFSSMCKQLVTLDICLQKRASAYSLTVPNHNRQVLYSLRLKLSER